MQELIQITTGGQGLPVVSARELYDFLGFDSSQWSRWTKKNIVNNPYAKEGEDWEGFDIMSSGNPTKDYALKLDFAKRLSMLARTQKGEEIRAYFLECERKVTQSPTPALLSAEQVILQQAHTLLEQGNLIAQLRADVDQLQTKGRSKIAPHLKQTPTLWGPPAKRNGTSQLRQLINRKVNEYCGYHGAEQGETYNYLYKRLLDVYSINVYRLQRNKGEYILDVLERYGHLDRLHSLIMAELTYSEE